MRDKFMIFADSQLHREVLTQRAVAPQAKETATYNKHGCDDESTAYRQPGH